MSAKKAGGSQHQSRDIARVASDSTQELAAHTAVVTGSSSGIGRAIALELAAAGADVLVHCRRSVDAAALAAEQVKALGGRSAIAVFDLADAANHERLVELGWSWQDGIDIWINNAGADVLTGHAAESSFDDKLHELWRVDVTATVRLTRLVGARMRARGKGVILNIGWDRATTGMEGDSGELFATTKGAIIAFTKSAALSLAPEVRVDCLAPGWIQTAWGIKASEYWQERAARDSQLGRWGTPEDVAKVARFLVSPDAAFLSGQIVMVNGGMA